MPMTGRLLRGTEFSLGFETDAYDLETTDFTIVAVSPTTGVSTPTTVTWEWRPGGTSDPEFEWVDADLMLVFTLASAWTASGFTVGKWTLYFLAGAPATVQNALDTMTLTVWDGGGGPMPT